MTPQRWFEVREILGHALATPTDARSSLLQQLCAADPDLLREVEALLASEDSAERLLPEDAGPLAFAGAVAAPPSQLGPYHILREVAHGGMGVVYEAERNDGQFDKRVAIKVLPVGFGATALRRRFLRERQILAEMEHPGIARILDGGIAPAGEPYFVMEFVDGLPVTVYAERNALPLAARLRLFLDICSAVSYAHGRLIVHRDLKPGNIFVGEGGVVKLLDFGLAQILESDATPEATQAILNFMTPAYASPEQILGKPFTVAGDVFSLGVVLYELVAGRRPFGGENSTSEEVRRAVLDQPPPPILHPGVAADLRTIVSKALEKDPGRRYASVESLAADLTNYLGGRPILARPDSLSYRAAKFVRRNGWPVLASAIAIAVVIAAAVIAIVEARAAQRRFDYVRQLANSVVFELHDAIAGIPGSTKARALLVRRGLEYLDRLSREPGNDPSLWRQLSVGYLRLGDAQGRPSESNLGDRAGAAGSYRKAIGILERLHARDPRDREVVRDLSRGLRALAVVTEDLPSRNALIQHALRLTQADAAAHPSDPAAQRDLAGSYFASGQEYASEHRYPESAAEFRKALALYRQSNPVNPTPGAEHDFAVCLKHLGASEVMSNDYSAALDVYQQARAIDEHALASNPESVQAKLDLSFDLSDIGTTLRRLDRLAEASEVYDRAAALRRQARAADPNDSRARDALASLLMRQGGLAMQRNRPNDAVKALKEASSLRPEPFPPAGRADYGEIEFLLARALDALGRPVEAFTHRHAAIEVFSALDRRGLLLPNQRDMYSQLLSH